MDQTTAWAGDREPSVDLDVFAPPQQRRWTVLLRIILAIPHLIVMWALSVGALVVVIIGWFAALFTGRLPEWAGDYLRSYVAYAGRVYGYTMLLVDQFPPFTLDTAPDYPVRVLFPQPTPLNRLAVLFRFFLALPILILVNWFMAGWAVMAIVIWLIVLITGRLPQALFESTAAVLRMQVRLDAYFYLLTPTYLKGIFGDGQAAPQPAPAPAYPATTGFPAADAFPTPAAGFPASSPTRPLLLSQAARILLIVMLVLGILSGGAQVVTGQTTDTDDDYVSLVLP
ncbi:DUF4389 domain-containing protein [Nocardia sp. NPDC003693]